jgi:NodT family efflux transporter outer membrane factor (OMF) lipoprotein
MIALGRASGILGTLCLMHTLSGCFIDTEKPEIQLDVPDRYRLAQGSAEANRTVPPALDWWRGFRSPELTALIEQAQTSNFDIAVAVANVMQADAAVRTAQAALLPAINMTATGIRSLPSTGGVPQIGASNTAARSTYTNSLTQASYVLDFWGVNRANLLQADENSVAMRYQKEVVGLTTISNVANAYFQVLAAQDRIRIARDNVAAASRILGLIRERLEVGTASTLETSQQEALLATQRASIPPLEILLQQNADALALLLGRAPEHYSVKGGSMNKIALPRVTPGLPSELLNRRPDIRAAEAALKSQNHNVEGARAAFFPSIALTNSAGFSSLALAALYTTPAFGYSAAANVTQPLFDGGTRLGALELAQGMQVAALQTYRKSVASAFSDVDNALVSLRQQTTRERLQIVAVKSSREAFNISESRLREGTLDLVTLLNTQETLFANEDTLAQVRLARLLGIVSLFQALGGGWPPQVNGDRPA